MGRLLLQLFLVTREDARVYCCPLVHININPRNTLLDGFNRKHIVDGHWFRYFGNNHIGMVCQVNVIHNYTE